MQIKAEEISKIIEDQIKNYEQRVEMSETGTVLYVGDGIARVYGVQNAMSMELLEFPGGVMGMVLNLEADNVGCGAARTGRGHQRRRPGQTYGQDFLRARRRQGHGPRPQPVGRTHRRPRPR